MNSFDTKISGTTVIFFILYVALVNIINTHSIKNVNIGGVYIYFLTLSLILFVFGALVLYRSIKYEFSSLTLLISSILLAAIAYFFGFLNWDPTGGKYYETPLFQLQVIFTTISSFILYLHYELNRRSSPNTKLISFVIFALTPHTLLNFFYLLTGNYSTDLAKFQNLTVVLLQLGTIFIFGWIVYSGRKISLVLLEQEASSVKKYGAMQLAGLYLLFLSVIGELIETVTPFEILNTPLFVIAFLLIGIPYYKDPKVFFLVPINIKAMGIIEESGLTLYFKAFSEEFVSDDNDLSAQLFGGLIMAFNSMGQEVVKTSKGVDSLNFGDRSIIIEYYEPYYFVIFASNATYFLQKEMKEYLYSLKQEYPSINAGAMIPEDAFEKLNEKFFPILYNL